MTNTLMSAFADFRFFNLYYIELSIDAFMD